MAIADNYVPIRQIGNGVTTQFSASWNMIDAAFALVYTENASTGVLTQIFPGAGAAQYQLTFNAGGFTVTYGTAPTALQYAVIARSVTLDQTNPYRTSKGFQGDVLESSLDKITAMVQDLNDTVGRSITFPLGSTASGALPSPIGNAGKVFSINATENGIDFLTPNTNAYLNVSAYMMTVLPAASASAARTLLGAAASGANSDITSLSGITSINGGQLGGFRNAIINGAFKIWQRATTYALTASIAYGSADRWAAFMVSSAAGIANRVSSTLTGFRYDMKLGRTAASALTNTISIYQVLETENSIPLQGKQVVLSFYAKAGANYSGAANAFSCLLNSGKGTDQSSTAVGAWTSEANQITNTVTLTTSYQRFQATATLPSDITQLYMQLKYTPTGVAGADDNVYITGIQLEPGAQATPFEDRSYGTELMLCQRYAPVINADGAASVIGNAFAYSANAALAQIKLPVTARIAPTGLTVSAGSHFSVNDGGSTIAFTTAAISNVSKDISQINLTGAAGLTTNRPYYAFFNNVAGQIIFTGCEL